MERNDFVIETFGLSYKSGVLKVVDLNKFFFYSKPFEEYWTTELLIAGNIVKISKFIAKIYWLNSKTFKVSEIGEKFVKTAGNTVFLTETPKKVAEILSLAKERHWLRELEDKNIALPLIDSTIFRIDEDGLVVVSYLDYIYGCEQKKFKFNKFKYYIL